MNTRHLLTALTLALGCTAGAHAADVGCRTVANGVQKCDVPTGAERSRADVVAEIHAQADTSTGCRTVANGVQKCDVPTGIERSRADVMAEVLNGSSGDTVAGCRTVANGVQKCDLPAQPADTKFARAPSAVEAH